MGLTMFHIRHFPSIVRSASPSVLELVRLGPENVRYGENLWAGRGTLTFFPSEIEEHMPLAPLEVLGAYQFSSGYSISGGQVLHRWALGLSLGSQGAELELEAEDGADRLGLFGNDFELLIDAAIAIRPAWRNRRASG